MIRQSITEYLRQVLNIFRKELLVILKDPSNRAMLIVPVVLQSLIFGYAATYDLQHASYALLDQSRSRAAIDLVARLDSSGIFLRVATLRNEADIAPVIDAQKALMVVHIGPYFEQALAAGREAPVQLILDARNSITAGNAGAWFAGVIAQFNEDWGRKHGAPAASIAVETRAWFNPNLNTRWNMLPSLIAALSMLQTLLLTALSVAREREQGTFDQLLVTPCTPSQIMIGKSAPCILVGLTQSTLILLVSTLWFKIPMSGSLVVLYGGLFIFTMASVGLGLSISALSANMQQAMLYAFIVTMPLMLLSGLATPVEDMPVAMRWLTSINPLRYAIHLVQRVYLEGVGLGAVMSDIVPLLLIAAATLPFAAWLFRHRLV